MVGLKTERTLSDKLSEAILYICKSNLKPASNFTVEGFLGIKLHCGESIFININEKFWHNCYNATNANGILHSSSDGGTPISPIEIDSDKKDIRKLSSDYNECNGCIEAVPDNDLPHNSHNNNCSKLLSENISHITEPLSIHCLQSDALSKPAQCINSNMASPNIMCMAQGSLPQTVHCIEQKSHSQSVQCLEQEALSQTVLYIESDDAYENSSSGNTDDDPIENSVINLCNTSFDSVQSVIDIPLINGKPLKQINEMKSDAALDDRVTGMWVQCGNEDCLAWRFVAHPAGTASIPYDTASQITFDQDAMDMDTQIIVSSKENDQLSYPDIENKNSVFVQNQMEITLSDCPLNNANKELTEPTVKKRVTRRSSANLLNPKSSKKIKIVDNGRIISNSTASQCSEYTQTNFERLLEYPSTEEKTVIGILSEDIKSAVKNDLNTAAENIIQNTNKLICQSTQDISVFLKSAQDTENTASNSLESIKEFQEKVLQQLKDVLKNQQNQMNMISQISYHKSNEETSIGEMLCSPIESKQELSKLCNSLSNEGLRSELKQFFNKLNTKELTKSIQAMMAALGSNHLWQDYCLCGTYDRISFEALPVHSVIVDAVRILHVNATLVEINTVIDNIFSWTSISKVKECSPPMKQVKQISSQEYSSPMKEEKQVPSHELSSAMIQDQKPSPKSEDCSSEKKSAMHGDTTLETSSSKKSEMHEEITRMNRIRKRCSICSTTKTKRWYGTRCITCYYTIRKQKLMRRKQKRRVDKNKKIVQPQNSPNVENKPPVKSIVRASNEFDSPPSVPNKRIKLTPSKEGGHSFQLRKENLSPNNYFDSTGSKDSITFLKRRHSIDSTNYKDSKQTLVVRLERIDEYCRNLKEKN